MSKLTDIAREVLAINDDFIYRVKEPRQTSQDDFELHTFEQIWGSTAGGFEVVGGCAMTTQRTYVFVPMSVDDNCFVYFGGRFAYAVPYSDVFIKDVKEHNVASVSRRGKYLKKIEVGK